MVLNQEIIWGYTDHTFSYAYEYSVGTIPMINFTRSLKYRVKLESQEAEHKICELF